MDEPRPDPIPTGPGAPIAQGVKALEDEAARLLESARAEGARILQESRRQAEEMAAAELPTDGVEAECQARIAAARDHARELMAQAEAEAAALRERAADRIHALAGEIVRIVSGASP